MLRVLSRCRGLSTGLVSRRGVLSTGRVSHPCPPRCTCGCQIVIPTRAFSTTTPTIPMHLMKTLREATQAPITECKQALTTIATSGTAPTDEKEWIEKATDWLRKKGVSTAAKKSGRAACDGLISIYLAPDRTRASIVEINSETDFASRAAPFQNVCKNAAITAAGLPTSTSGLLDISKLASAPTSDAPSITDAITNVIASMRENLSLRRGGVVSVPTNKGIVAMYVHNAIDTSDAAVRLGKIGAIIALESDTTDKEELIALGNKLCMHIVAANPLYLTEKDVPCDILDREIAVLTEQAQTSKKPKNIIDKMVQGRLSKFYEDFVLLNQKFLISASEDAKPTSVTNVLAEAGKQLGSPIRLTSYVRFAVGEGLQVDTSKKMSFAEEVAAKRQGL